MIRQANSRHDSERRAEGALLHLLCAVSVWRTVMTRILPLCGASAWWTALLCLLPGIAVAALLRGLMHITGTDTLTEACRAALGGMGAILLPLTLALPLLADGLSSITALITLFTQGIGTSGTQLTLAALTGVMLLFSLHREGLARAVYLLRWILAAAAAVLAVTMLGEAKLDHLFPLYGTGEADVFAAVKAGVSLAWPLALLLTLGPSSGQGRLRGGLLSVLWAAAAVLLLTLTIPQELIIRQEGLADWLLLPTRYTPNALRLLALCLVLLTFFLAIGAAVQQATQLLCSPMKAMPAWLPHGLLAAMFLTQAGDDSLLWTWLGRIEPWLLAPLAGLAVICLPIALLRRNRR